MTPTPKSPLHHDALPACAAGEDSTVAYAPLATPKGKIQSKLEEEHRHSETRESITIAKEESSVKNMPFLDLYRYASRMDKVMVALGCLFAGVNGALFPCMALVFGNAIQSFQGDGTVDSHAVNQAALDYLYIAIALFLTDYLAYVLFVVSAERQMKALRAAALTHMLYMDITWYDQHDALQLSSRLTGDTVKIKDGMGQKLGDSFKYTCQFLTGYCIGFIKGWDISLVMSCVMPIMAMSLASMLKMLRSRAEHSQKMYAQAGAVAEETLASIRTVASLNGETRAMEKYNKNAIQAEQENIEMATYASVVFGLFMGSIWIMYAAGLWYGGWKVSHDRATPGSVFQSFFGVLMGTISLAQISPNISAVAEARGAAAALYEILDTPSAIDASKQEEGLIPDTCEGKIEAKGIYFTYPTRPDAPVLVNYNVTIQAGETVAFVGSSGSGKSTLISLLERFYDPQSGVLEVDGYDIKTLNVSWLRSQIGMVSQEPVLFATTIYANIATAAHTQEEEFTREQVINAARMANAHDFIMSLPQQYETLVGEKGVSLSGGQKQRIAIARAIVRTPKILVLDEATSALDNESERVVQTALNALMQETSMTTLVIAHRLSTIRHADKILVLSNGRVVEEGRHDVLVVIPNGVYAHLYNVQAAKAEEEAAEAAAELELVSVDGKEEDEKEKKETGINMVTFNRTPSTQTNQSIENEGLEIIINKKEEKKEN